MLPFEYEFNYSQMISSCQINNHANRTNRQLRQLTNNGRNGSCTIFRGNVFILIDEE